MYIEDINLNQTHILLKCDVKYDIKPQILKDQQIIQNTIDQHPEFMNYTPIKLESNDKIINMMIESSTQADVGPMATVAGSISEDILNHLKKHNMKNIIVENGGDIALKTTKKSIMSLYAGDKNPFSYKIGFKIKNKPHGYGICTSANIGSSHSLGLTDATVVFSRKCSLSDALATRIANSGTGTQKDEIIQNALECADNYKDKYDGVVVIKDDLIAKVGHIPDIVSIEDVKNKYETIIV